MRMGDITHPLKYGAKINKIFGIPTNGDVFFEIFIFSIDMKVVLRIFINMGFVP